MPYQLNPSKVPIWKTETELRIGLSDQDQVLQDVGIAQERLINLLFQGIPETGLEQVGDSLGLTEVETRALIEKLRPSLLEQNQSNGSGSALDVRFAEIVRLGFDTNAAPETVLAKRAQTLIQLPKLNRTGLLLIKVLAEAGFSKFETLEYDNVRREDIGELSYRPDQLGISRLAAAREILEASAGKITINLPEKRSRKKVELIVITAMHQVNPKDYRELETPHLAIEYGIEQLKVSPIIRPGSSPCLNCRDLWESENNPDWAAVAIQLTARNDHLDDGAGLLLAAGISAKSICQFTDQALGAATQGFQVSLKTRQVQAISWQLHPACRCAAKNQKPNPRT
jgi:hypothetical protein